MLADFTTALFPGHCLEERVTEDTVIFRGPVQGINPPPPFFLCHKPLLHNFRTHSLDHGREGQFRESFDKLPAGGIDIDHTRRDTDIPESGTTYERIELPPDQCIAPCQMLEFHEAADCPAGIGILRVEVCRAVIPFDHRDRSAVLQERAELFEYPGRIQEVFENKTDEDVIEAGRFERKAEQIRLPEFYICDPFFQYLFPGTLQRISRNINGYYPCSRAVP